jgi:AcrR family transcriptional regulator
MSESVKRRPYRSPLREDQARLTRRRVTDAARELFLTLGYARTTIARVATEADVAPDTVYHLFGSKRELLKHVLDVTVAGDDEDVALLERADPQAMRAEADQGRQVEMFATGMSAQLERVRPLDDMLRSAAAVDADIAALRDDVQLRQRRQAMTTVAGWIAARGPLRAGMSVDDAGATIWTLTSAEVHHMLRVGWGWSADQYRAWLADTLRLTLLEPARRRR